MKKGFFDQYWFGKGDRKLTKREFAEIAAYAESVVGNYRKNGALKMVDAKGNVYYQNVISFYSNEKFDFAFGSATVAFNERGKAVGFFDVYDFDPKPYGKRGLLAETVTRAVYNNSPPMAKPYFIYYGINSAKNMNSIR